jgi:hypothetical protein
LIFRGNDDPYCLARIDEPFALPEREDWNFRLDVLCQVDSRTTIFGTVLQGLMKFCIPSGAVTDEIKQIEAGLQTWEHVIPKSRRCMNFSEKKSFEDWSGSWRNDSTRLIKQVMQS